MAEPVTCLDCGTVNPPPEMTCHGGDPGGMLRDHFVGTEPGCGNCGRLVMACARRPCSALREQSYEAGWDDDSEEGHERGHRG